MRLARFALALCLAGGLTTSTALAAPITITFDEPARIVAGDELSNQYADLGVTFSPNGFTGPGGPTGDWATNTDMTIVSSTGSDVGNDLGTPSLVSGNVLRSFEEWNEFPPDGEGGDPSFLATFSGPGITMLSATFAGISSLEDDKGVTRLIAYSGTEEVATAVASAVGGTKQAVLTVSSDKPITSVVFTPGSFFDYVVVDNITFTPIVVPEPASLTLLALGVAAAARSRRRR